MKNDIEGNDKRSYILIYILVHKIRQRRVQLRDIRDIIPWWIKSGGAYVSSLNMPLRKFEIVCFYRSWNKSFHWGHSGHTQKRFSTLDIIRFWPLLSVMPKGKKMLVGGRKDSTTQEENISFPLNSLKKIYPCWIFLDTPLYSDITEGKSLQRYR